MGLVSIRKPLKYESRNLRLRHCWANFGRRLFETRSSSDDGDTRPEKGGSGELGSANAGGNGGKFCRGRPPLRNHPVGGFLGRRGVRCLHYPCAPYCKENFKLDAPPPSGRAPH